MSWAILLFHCSVFTFIVSYSVTVISATGLMSWAVLLFHCSVFTCIVSYSVTVISASGLMSWAVRTIKVYPFLSTIVMYNTSADWCLDSDWPTCQSNVSIMVDWHVSRSVLHSSVYNFHHGWRTYANTMVAPLLIVPGMEFAMVRWTWWTTSSWRCFSRTRNSCGQSWKGGCFQRPWHNCKCRDMERSNVARNTSPTSTHHVWWCIVPIHLPSIGKRTTRLLVFTYPWHPNVWGMSFRKMFQWWHIPWVTWRSNVCCSENRPSTAHRSQLHQWKLMVHWVSQFHAPFEKGLGAWTFSDGPPRTIPIGACHRRHTWTWDGVCSGHWPER